jgi:hypothetical protein
MVRVEKGEDGSLYDQEGKISLRPVGKPFELNLKRTPQESTAFGRGSDIGQACLKYVPNDFKGETMYYEVIKSENDYTKENGKDMVITKALIQLYDK